MNGKIYVGHALTHASRRFLDEMERLKQLLAAEGFEMLSFAWRDGKPLAGVDDVYQYDLDHVEECDVFVAVSTVPSIGLGMELERAFAIRRTTLVFVERGMSLTRIVPHGLAHHGLPPPGEYGGVEEIVQMVKSYCEGRVTVLKQ